MRGTSELSRSTQILFGIGLVIAGVVILGAAVTGADVQARGFDFREPLARWLGGIVGLIALGVGIHDLTGGGR